jgi:restriction endonuclease Mrr
MEGAVRRLIEENRRQTTELDEETFSAQFDEVDIHRFGQTETEYKDWAVGRLQDRHTTTVSYTGDNNVTYTKTCEPNQSDVSVQAITPLYLPQIRQTVQLGEYAHPYEYYAAGPSRVTVEDGIHSCDQCSTSGQHATYTYCENCGSINCSDHVKTERVEKTPVCTGCAVTERFAFKTKYFYNQENLKRFRTEYEQMALHEKARENPALIAGLGITAVLLIVLTLAGLGVL